MKIKLSSMKRISRQTGVSLIEVVAYLAIAGLVIAGALAMFTSASQSQLSNAIISDTQNIRAATRATYSGNYGATVGSLLQVLKNSAKIPSNWTVSGTTATVTGSVVASVSGNSNLFRISYGNVPRSVCIDLLLSLRGQRWINVVAANGTSAQTATTAIPTTTGTSDFTPATADTACTSDAMRIDLISS